jgi:hypothetical protein
MVVEMPYAANFGTEGRKSVKAEDMSMIKKVWIIMIINIVIMIINIIILLLLIIVMTIIVIKFIGGRPVLGSRVIETHRRNVQGHWH